MVLAARGCAVSHTPLPWKFVELAPKPDGIGYIRPEDEDRKEITHHDDMGRSRQENLANADLIVRSVNSHDALVEALKGWQDHLRGSLNCMDAKEQALFFAGEKALDAAFKKAGEAS